MTIRPRKFTNEINRARALEVLRIYESGVRTKDIAAQYDMEVGWVWQRIQFGRLLRARMVNEAAE